MPTIDRMIGAATPSFVETKSTAQLATVQASGNVAVSRQILKRLEAAAITPPEPGALLSLEDVDQKLATTKLSTVERMEVKNALVAAGLLSPGKPLAWR